MARKVREIAERDDYELTEGTLEFLESHLSGRSKRRCRCAAVGPQRGVWG